jgi:hypothetical protein
MPRPAPRTARPAPKPAERKARAVEVMVLLLACQRRRA